MIKSPSASIRGLDATKEGMEREREEWVSALQSRNANNNNNNVKLVLSISGWADRPFNHGVKGANALYHHWTVSGANCGHISLSGSPGWPTIWPAGAAPWLNADKVPVRGGLSCGRQTLSETESSLVLKPPTGPPRFSLSHLSPPWAVLKNRGAPVDRGPLWGELREV